MIRLVLVVLLCLLAGPAFATTQTFNRLTDFINGTINGGVNTVITLGAASVGDGYGATYTAVSCPSPTTPVVVNIAGSTCWKNAGSAIYLESLGGVADGSTDQTALFNAAVPYYTALGDTFALGKGTYWFATEPYFNNTGSNPFQLVGAGMGVSLMSINCTQGLTYNGTAPRPTVTANPSGGSDAGGTYYVRIAYYNGSSFLGASPVGVVPIVAGGYLTVNSPAASNIAGVTQYGVYVGTTQGDEYLSWTSDGSTTIINVGTAWSEPTTASSPVTSTTRPTSVPTRTQANGPAAILKNFTLGQKIASGNNACGTSNIGQNIVVENSASPVIDHVEEEYSTAQGILFLYDTFPIITNNFAHDHSNNGGATNSAHVGRDGIDCWYLCTGGIIEYNVVWNVGDNAYSVASAEGDLAENNVNLSNNVFYNVAGALDLYGAMYNINVKNNQCIGSQILAGAGGLCYGIFLQANTPYTLFPTVADHIFFTNNTSDQRNTSGAATAGCMEINIAGTGNVLQSDVQNVFFINNAMNYCKGNALGLTRTGAVTGQLDFRNIWSIGNNITNAAGSGSSGALNLTTSTAQSLPAMVADSFWFTGDYISGGFYGMSVYSVDANQTFTNLEVGNVAAVGSNGLGPFWGGIGVASINSPETFTGQSSATAGTGAVLNIGAASGPVNVIGNIATNVGNTGWAFSNALGSTNNTTGPINVQNNTMSGYASAQTGLGQSNVPSGMYLDSAPSVFGTISGNIVNNAYNPASYYGINARPSGFSCTTLNSNNSVDHTTTKGVFATGNVPC